MSDFRGSDKFFYFVTGGLVCLFSLGCFLITDEPDPTPAVDDCQEFDTIPEVVDDDFFANDDCDTVGHIVVVREGTLVVESGTTLVFDDGAGIRIEEEGSLDARGTDDELITFTGSDTSAGSWKGIFFDGVRGRDNILEHVIVEYGGGESWDGTETMGPANLTIMDARVEFANFSFFDSGGYGLDMGGDSDLRINGENEITTSAFEPVRTTPALVDALTTDTTYRGNESDFIFVTAGTVEQSSVWENFDVPLVLRGTVVLRGSLRIAAGSELVFEDGAGIEIGDGGGLDMDGDEDEIIVIE